MVVLKSPVKVEVRQSPIHGYGVFAIDKINKGEIIEECHLLTIPFKLGEFNSFLINYKFNYPSVGPIEEYVIPLGNGCIYNHSNNNNAFWQTNKEHKTFEFVAKRDIEIGEEICTFYGDSTYWETVNKFSKEKVNVL
jgi:SET domain-containing protein